MGVGREREQHERKAQRLPAKRSIWEAVAVETQEEKCGDSCCLCGRFGGSINEERVFETFSKRVAEYQECRCQSFIKMTG